MAGTKASSQRLASWIFGGIAFAFLIGVFIFGPNELPPQKHRTGDGPSGRSRALVSAGTPNLPSWLRGFDSRHPLSLRGRRSGQPIHYAAILTYGGRERKGQGGKICGG